MYIKKSRFLFFQLKDGTTVNIEDLMNGVPSLLEVTQLIVYSVVAQNSFVITKEEFDLLYAISSKSWQFYSLNDEDINRFASRGFILVKDSTDEEFNKFLKNEQTLIDGCWNELSAFYHFSTKWDKLNLKFKIDVEKLRTKIDEQCVIRDYIKKKGFPPNHFYSFPNPIQTISLPKNFKFNEFFGTLVERKTTRLFDAQKKLSLDELSNILFYTFGCHGLTSVYRSEDGEAFALKKTSPSGGGLHPTETYLLINRVEGLSPGLYHYSVQNHSLELLKDLDIERVKDLANIFTAGQDYPSNANVIAILTSRYFRNYWKYDQHPHAYKVLLMDAAHLSQTFYLTCANLKLGAFTTAAINAKYIEQELNINGFEEGALLVVGCGFPIDVDLAPKFEPYNP